ncbi:Error-prone repair protein ImuA [Sphingobacterium sp. DN00404]|uniref:Error-prone repair protein ImuA n=1 Tax=Sphingobacterium micropteri TaxID=2763501 RepID=A0ABR7YQK5_9SPHI|nr:Error-prone repair protein ImuA [Sphingobacterium micropteri]MBD1433604.1 Error-prone repair protein ImuA [Sphingobacterium micropteri]
MRTSIEKSMLIADLQHQILQWQGFKQVERKETGLGLGALEQAFPGNVFPMGTLHEFISDNKEEEAASSGFLGGLLSFLMQKDGVALWISSSDQLFAPAMTYFGLEPDRIIFIQMQRQVDILWALEEGLKCMAVKVVVAELQEINFAQSRRLQLVVEKSRVTGLLLRLQPRMLGATTCAVRWHIRPQVSHVEGDMPGVGFPAWKVELLKVKNGQSSRWQLAWTPAGLQVEQLKAERTASPSKRKVG